MDIRQGLGVALTWGWLAAAAGAQEATSIPVTLYTKGNAPATPKLEALKLADTVSQYGITWKFDQPVRVGQFVTGDWYVVGPVTVTGIEPKPEQGRNGSCLNVVNGEKAGFDSRHGQKAKGGRFDPALFLAPPIDLKPGDSLCSSISLKEIGKTKAMLWPGGGTNVSPVGTIAVLTCLAAPAPADAFRPSYVGKGKGQQLYLARDLKRDLLPKLARQGLALRAHGHGDFTIQDVAGWFRRPWVDLVLDEFTAPMESMPRYGREFVRAVGIAGLLLCLDYAPEEKEPLLIGFVQLGVDLWGMAGQGGQPASWKPLGGHGNGRKWPIIFAGIMLDDKEMQHPVKKFTYLRFSEDAQTMFDRCWTGAGVVWAGHVGPEGLPNKKGWGRYEHLPPAQWEGDALGESYRRCCTSNAWVGQALAARLLRAEKVWDYDPYFAYVDRWMYEDDAGHRAQIKSSINKDFSSDWIRQGAVWDQFVKDLWDKYRTAPGMPPTDGWKKQGNQ